MNHLNHSELRIRIDSIQSEIVSALSKRTASSSALGLECPDMLIENDWCNCTSLRGCGVFDHSTANLIEGSFEVHNLRHVAVAMRKFTIPLPQPPKATGVVQHDVLPFGHGRAHSLLCDLVSPFPLATCNAFSSEKTPFGIDLIQTNVQTSRYLGELLSDGRLARECHPAHDVQAFHQKQFYAPEIQLLVLKIFPNRHSRRVGSRTRRSRGGHLNLAEGGTLLSPPLQVTMNPTLPR
jgi:hypothetical protein